MRLPSQFNDDLAAISLVKGTGSPPEIYIPLWWYSGAVVGVSSAVTSAGSQFVQRGSSSTSSTAKILYTVNANWPSSTKFAFEGALFSSGTGYAALWDVTANAIISGSQVSVTSNGNYTVTRSGQFNIPPGHQIAITLWCNGSGGVSITDASLIVFPS